MPFDATPPHHWEPEPEDPFRKLEPEQVSRIMRVAKAELSRLREEDNK